MSRTQREDAAVADAADAGGESAIAAGIWRGALDLLGPDGQFWAQGYWRRDDPCGAKTLRCVATACMDTPLGAVFEHYESAIRALSMALDSRYSCLHRDERCIDCAVNIVMCWNDSAANYAEIRSGIERAVEREENR